MSTVHVLAAVRREQRRLQQLDTNLRGNHAVTPAVACLVASAVEDLADAADQLRAELDRQAAGQ